MLQVFIGHQVVPIDKDNELSPGMVDAAIPGGTGAAVLLMQGDHPRVLSGKFVADCTASIFASVIDQYDLVVRKALGQQTIDAVPKVRGRVIDRDDD